MALNVYYSKAISYIPTSDRITQRLTRQHAKRVVEITGILILSTLLISLLRGHIKRPTNLSSLYSSSHFGLSSSAQWPQWPQVKHIFVFGDSYSDTGYDLYKMQPTPANPFGNPDWQLNLRSGSTWMHFLGLDYNATSLKIYNHAIGGSTIDPDIVPPYLGMVRASFRFQLKDQFMEVYAQRPDFAPWLPEDTLFILWFGVNDVVIPACQMQYPPIPELLDSYAGKMRQLYDIGARNFLTLNVPPVHKAHPKADYSTFEGAAILDWNHDLRMMRDKFVRNNTDASVMLFDAHSLWTQALQNPKQFPQTATLSVTAEPCDAYSADGAVGEEYIDPVCDAPIGEYYWLNVLHATYAVHNATASFVVEDCFAQGGPRGFCS